MKMFTAGPVNVTDSVKKSMAYSEIGHRETEFEEIYSDTCDKLLKAFGVDKKTHVPFIIGGSGTQALETVISSNIHNGNKMLVVNNGFFGDRMHEICETYGIRSRKTNNLWGEPPSLEGIEKLLSSDPHIEAVAATLLETSTGMVNPIYEIGQLCKKYDKLFIVDAVSGFAGDHLNTRNSQVDFCISNSNKGLSGLPVISFGVARKSAVERIKDIKPRNYSLNLPRYLKYGEKNQTPFTPQIPLFLMLNQALKELLEEGVVNRISRYQENSSLLRDRLTKLGFRFQLSPEHMSNVMTNVLLPANYTYEEFHHPLKEQGYIIYPGKGPLEGKILHIGNVGTHTTKDVSEICDSIAKIVEKKKIEY